MTNDESEIGTVLSISAASCRGGERDDGTGVSGEETIDEVGVDDNIGRGGVGGGGGQL